MRKKNSFISVSFEIIDFGRDTDVVTASQTETEIDGWDVGSKNGSVPPANQ